MSLTFCALSQIGIDNMQLHLRKSHPHPIDCDEDHKGSMKKVMLLLTTCCYGVRCDV